jgi:hypothetical protein
MATFYLKKGNTEVDIESEYGLRVTSVRGLEPPQPKELYTRDWASRDGVDYYAPAARFKQASDIIMTIWIEDHPSDSSKTALKRYHTFCAYVFDGDLTYRDTLQKMEAEVRYKGNKNSWYQFVGKGQVMAEITFMNTSGTVTLNENP